MNKYEKIYLKATKRGGGPSRGAGAAESTAADKQAAKSR